MKAFEDAEDPRVKFGRDPDAIVLDPNTSQTIPLLNSDGDFCADSRRHEFDRVGEQVPQHLDEGGPVGQDPTRSIGADQIGFGLAQ